MTTSADISVVPTGGMTPVDLADLAADVQTLMSAQTPILQLFNMGYQSGPQVQTYVLKQTDTIEAFGFYFDGSPTSLAPDQGPLGGLAITDVPDGLLPYVWNTSLPGSAVTPGAHTLLIKGLMSGAQVTGNYTV